MKINQSNDLDKDKSVGSFPMFGLLPDESSENRRNGHGPLPKQRLNSSP